jgi:hypothetical protein
MTVSRGLALAAAVLAVQFSLVARAQASPLQAADLTAPVSALHVGFFVVEPHRLAPLAPLLVSAESSVSYGRMVSSTSLERPSAAGALGAYYAGGSVLSALGRSQAFAPSGSMASGWPQAAGRWQFEETTGDWRSRSGHWHDFEDEHGHPPAVPIPAGLWLLASGLALLAPVIRAQRGRNTQGPAIRTAGEAA